MHQSFEIEHGEDGCVEIDLASGIVTGIATAESLLVDAGNLVRDGQSRRGCTAVRIPQGARVSLPDHLLAPPARTPRPTSAPVREVVVEEGQHRQLASWRTFARASQGGLWSLAFDGWQLVAWSDDGGGVVFDIEVAGERPGR